MAAVKLRAVVQDPTLPTPGTSSGSRALLPLLLAELDRARQIQHDQQQERGVTATIQTAGHRAVLEALERYAVALQASDLPVPRSIHADIQLRRSLCGLPIDTASTSRSHRAEGRVR